MILKGVSGEADGESLVSSSQWASIPFLLTVIELFGITCLSMTQFF